MSYSTAAATATRSTKVSRLTQAVRRNWSEARNADRQLMQMRTNLSRHSG
jgi:hypothetical protein